MDAKFLRFLKNNNAFSAYCKNCQSQTTRPFPVFRGINVFKLKKKDLIMYAFAWHRTPEGYKFWEKLDKKWKET